MKFAGIQSVAHLPAFRYKTIKTMCYSAPDVLDALLSHLADQMAAYIKYQIDSGAHAIQVREGPAGQAG
jgi:uroporphyrinogen decarboxylase